MPIQCLIRADASRRRFSLFLYLICWVVCLSPVSVLGQRPAAGPPATPELAAAYLNQIRPLLKTYCVECHSAETAEAEVNLEEIVSHDLVRQNPQLWQKVRTMLDSGQMPPKDAAQPTDAEKKTLRQWVRAHLAKEAEAQAGDPGRVVLRRLSNSEYTYTLRDLTGLPTIEPAHEFPVDGAAGEGFTNTGSGLVMSPALVTKYLDAAKELADHAMMLPDGIRYAPSTSPRDWTDSAVATIQAFYDRFADEGGGSAVNLQGIAFDTNQGGRLPLKVYFDAIRDSKVPLSNDAEAIAQTAHERGLSPKYLTMLVDLLANSSPAAEPSRILQELRSNWQSNRDTTVSSSIEIVERWQQALFKFNPVGHIGRAEGPTSWLEAVNPIVARQEIAIKLTEPANAGDVTLYLAANSAGDGSDHDQVVWESPRLRVAGRPDLLLRDVRRVASELSFRRKQISSNTAKCLQAVTSIDAVSADVNVAALAQQFQLDVDLLAAWLDYLGMGPTTAAHLGTPINTKTEGLSGHAFVKAWAGEDALSVIANSSDEHVRIPGNLAPHSIAVHPSPTRTVAIGWRSPIAGPLNIQASVQHAHPECGNGVAWSLQLRRGRTRQQLASGVAHGAAIVNVGPLPDVAIQKGDVVVLAVNPRDGDHSCDLTAVTLTLANAETTWNLADDVSSDILAGNPHPDRRGHNETWHFFSEPATGAAEQHVPAGSLLAQWQLADKPEQRQAIAEQLQQLLQSGPNGLPADSPDIALYRQLTSVGGPLMSTIMRQLANHADVPLGNVDARYGLDEQQFSPNEPTDGVPAGSLNLQAPAIVAIRVPAELAAGAEFVTTATLHPVQGREGSVQVQATVAQQEAVKETPPADLAAFVNAGHLSPTHPIITHEGTDARRKSELAFGDFRRLFPPALCYTRIVPVDEVVTLRLFYREDDYLQRLMLDESQVAQLNQLWDELYFVSREPFALVTSFEQLAEFATQDRPDLVKAFIPLRAPIESRAAEFRQRLIDTEPVHLQAVLEFADRAWRRKLTAEEQEALRALYAGLRASEIDHEPAIRLIIARVLTAPAFLYRLEEPVAGKEPGPVSDLELATRLSYFLWSSAPDDELRHLAETGNLTDDKVLLAQTDRMLKDAKMRRMAVEFGCQWLHIRDFDQNDEKNESLFPEFATLRVDMYEEAVRFFEEMFRGDGPVIGLLDANHTFLNEALANHYGIAGVQGVEWRRVDNVRARGRGGVLAMASVLAAQSGASRTSPILRGNWVYETLLGEKLPRPPANVPQLPESLPENLNERQLIELHSSAPECAKCHIRIDPYGFALEQYDAIGRQRPTPVDTRTTLDSGKTIEGIDGLRDYLRNDRHDDFLHQFCRKLLGYALGREVQLSDETLLADMQQQLQANDYRFSVAVKAIVLSPQFRNVRGQDGVYNDGAFHESSP